MRIISKITDVSPWSDDVKVPKEDYKFCTMQQRKTVYLLACDYFVKKWNRDIPVKEFCFKKKQKTEELANLAKPIFSLTVQGDPCVISTIVLQLKPLWNSDLYQVHELNFYNLLVFEISIF